MKMCQALANEGNKVYLITRGKIDTQTNDYNYYGVESNFKILKYNIKNVRIISSLLFSIFINSKIRELKPDLIYTRHRFSLLILQYFKIPIIFEDHSPPNGLYKYIIKSVSKKNIIKIVLISNVLKKLYKTKISGIEKIKIIVAHDGADPINNQINNSKILQLDKLKINCGYVGHLYKGRGINIIMKTAVELPEIAFHIIGGDEKEIINWQSINKQKNVTFHGFINNSKIPVILKEFDILLAPYQNQVYLKNSLNTADWMSPLKIFEYMSSGKPIICSRIKVLEEILDNGINAIMISPDNINEWVTSIKELIRNVPLRKKIGEKALQDFLKNYTWNNRANRILNE